MIVYRLEHKDLQIGPYYTRPQVAHESDRWPTDDCPGSYDDFGTTIDSDVYLFGFDSIEKLYTWFASFKGNLTNFRITHYKIFKKHTKMGRSKKQLIFKRAHAKLIKKYEFKRIQKAI